MARAFFLSPAPITLFVWKMGLSVILANSVVLYQSKLFSALFPEENRRFGNVIYVDAIPVVIGMQAWFKCGRRCSLETTCQLPSLSEEWREFQRSIGFSASFILGSRLLPLRLRVVPHESWQSA